jgi:hypothetical protein
MKLAVIALSTAVVIASAPAVFARGVSSKTPGRHMQKYGKKAGHRASSYAPGQRMQANRSKTGSPGVFGYAPRPDHWLKRRAARFRWRRWLLSPSKFDWSVKEGPPRGRCHACKAS